MMIRKLVPLAGALVLAACGETPYDPRGVDREETLLSVSATGEAETRPDEARFQAGVNNWAASARAASDANAEDIREIVAALRAAGVAENDIQTRNVGVQRIDYGDRRGQYQASNIVAVTVREVDRTGEVISAVTDAGANIVSGPDLRVAEPEKAANTAYGAAYKAARAGGGLCRGGRDGNLARADHPRHGRRAGQPLLARRSARCATAASDCHGCRNGSSRIGRGYGHGRADDQRGRGPGGLRARAQIAAACAGGAVD